MGERGVLKSHVKRFLTWQMNALCSIPLSISVVKKNYKHMPWIFLSLLCLNDAVMNDNANMNFVYMFHCHRCELLMIPFLLLSRHEINNFNGFFSLLRYWLSVIWILLNFCVNLLHIPSRHTCESDGGSLLQESVERDVFKSKRHKLMWQNVAKNPPRQFFWGCSFDMTHM